jgi:arylsulfatase A-like enzyme
VSNGDRRPANDYGFDRWVGLHINHDYYTHKLVATGELDMYEDGKPYPDREGAWCDTVFADEAIKFIKTESEEPFFIYLPFQAPHAPFQDPDVPHFKPVDDWQNKPVEVRSLVDKMIERLDLEIGRVLNALDELGLSEDTLVILTSDNGGHKGGNVGRNLPLRGAKQGLEEGGIRVPLIFRWPGVLAKGTEFSEPIHAMDLTATIAAVGGASHRTDQPFDGVNVLPALKGERELPSKRPFFFRRFRGRTGNYQQSAVRQGDWKYLRNYRGSEKYTEALYNLRSDIGETKDLTRSAPEKLNALRRLLEKWELEMSKTAAPLKKK